MKLFGLVGGNFEPMKIHLVTRLLLVGLVLNLVAPAQTNIVPVVDLRLGGLIGGSENGAWVETGIAAESILSGSMNLNIFGFSGREKKMIRRATRGPVDDVCQDFFRLKTGARDRLGLAIGSNAKWNPMSRIPKHIPARSAVYTNAVASFLKTHGVSKPRVKIVQAFKIDLDGDGKDEVLITATNIRDDFSTRLKPGEYSIVLLRKATKAGIRDYMVDGNIYKRGQEDAGPKQRYEITGIADLNGDGKIEVVIYAEYYEGAATAAFELRGGKLELINAVQASCGV